MPLNKDAQLNWEKESVKTRINILLNYQKELETHKEAIAQSIHSDMNKLLWEARLEVNAMIGKVGISIDAFLERCPETVHDMDLSRGILRHKAHGFVAVIGPFNFPGHLPNGHIAPALLAGNGIVFKPSEHGEKTAEIISELLYKSGISKEVFMLQKGGKECVESLVCHPDIHGIFFTGSAEVGKKIAHMASSFPRKLVALEMGGNNALIVDSVSDIKAAAYTIIHSAYITGGQRCTCARRLICMDTPSNRTLIDSVANIASKLKIGRNDDCFYGPLVHKEAAKKVKNAYDYRCQLGGKKILESTLLNDGCITPGLIDATEAHIPDEEVFGPLLSLYWVDTLDEALQIANDTRYGLAASVLSLDKAIYDEVRFRHPTGVINWNLPTTGANSRFPFGGVGDSGNFRPSAYYAADYCSYPVSSLESETVSLPKNLLPGITF